MKNLQKLAREHLVEEYEYSAVKEIKFCKLCLEGKQHRSPFHSHPERKSTEVLQLVHSDVCEKIDSKFLSVAEYFLTFIGDKTQYVWVYVIRHKREVFNKFCEWKLLVEVSLGKEVKALRIDNGGKFTSNEFEEYLRKDGVKHKLKIQKCPQQNGIAERTNRTLVEMVKLMVADSKLPKAFWAEALATTIYLRNRCPTKAVKGKTPYEALTGEKPKVEHLRVFRHAAYSHIPKDA